MSITTRIEGRGQAIFLNGDVMKRVQSVDLSTDLGVENIQELGNAEFVEKLPDLPKVSISIETNDVGSIANLMLLKTGSKLTGVTRDAQGVYQGLWVPTTTTNIVMDGNTQDLDHDKLPTFIYKISEFNNNTLDRSCLIQGAYLDSIEFNYDVGGLAKENFKFSGDYKAWYVGAKKDIDIDYPTYSSATKITTTVDKDDVSGVLEAVFIDGIEVYNNAKSIDLYQLTWTDNEITAGVGSPFKSDQRIEVIYSISTARNFPKLSSVNTGSIGGLRRGCIHIYAYKTGMAGEKRKLLRCQTLSGSLDLGRQDDYELGYQRFISRKATYPLNVRFDLTFNESDLRTMAISQHKLSDYEGATLTHLDMSLFKDIDVEVEIYKDAYKHDNTTLAKKLVFKRCRVINEGDSGRVGNSPAQWKISFQTDNITWTGYPITL